MAIYKPSNLTPTMQEIDVLKDQIFTCQVNTSGDTVERYKIQMFSDRGEFLGDTGIINKRARNKNTLQMSISKEWFASIDSSTYKKQILNGKDYQWNVRTYLDTTKVNTLVCDGFIVGSTKYVIWVDASNFTQDQLDQIVYDRYIEFSVAPSYVVQGAKEDEDYVFPTSTVIERRKISWVEKELGKDKNYIKIEVEEPFDYNYKDGTPFSIYQCSGENTVYNAFADPNGEINQSDYMFIYKTLNDAKAAKDAGETPSSSNIDVNRLSASMYKGIDEEGKKFYRARKITGYSSDTGEIRVIDTFGEPPKNGEYYRLFTYNVSDDTYTPVDDNANNLISHRIGGVSITNNNYKVTSNSYSNNAIERLFIQPNINIKVDESTYGVTQIVFDDGTKIVLNNLPTISSVTGKIIDSTFEKLDNTQWLLTASSIKSISIVTPLSQLIVPQRDYQVYTNFMESMPNSIFYARKTPTITIKVKEYPDGATIQTLASDGSTIFKYKDILFIGEISSNFKPSIKYYQYTLYSGDEINEDNLVIQSNEIYDNSLEWHYRGLESYVDQELLEKYIIHLMVVDEYDCVFEIDIPFGVRYEVNAGYVPLIVNMECHEKANQISVSMPLKAETTSINEDITTVTNSNIVEKDLNGYNYVKIDNNKVLNYTKILGSDELINLPERFTFNTQFNLTSSFVEELMNLDGNNKEKGDNSDYPWEIGKEKEIFKITNENNVYQLVLTSLEPFYSIKNGTIYKIDDEQFVNDKWVINEEAYSFKLYKNGVEQRFKNGSGENYTLWSLAKKTDYFKVPKYLKYALQKKEQYYYVTNDSKFNNLAFIDIEDYNGLSSNNDRIALINAVKNKGYIPVTYPFYVILDVGKAPIFKLPNNGAKIQIINDTDIGNYDKWDEGLSLICEEGEETINELKYIVNDIKIEKEEGNNYINYSVKTGIKKFICLSPYKRNEDNSIFYEYIDSTNYACQNVQTLDFYEDSYVFLDHLAQLIQTEVPNPFVIKGWDKAKYKEIEGVPNDEENIANGSRNEYRIIVKVNHEDDTGEHIILRVYPEGNIKNAYVFSKYDVPNEEYRKTAEELGESAKVDWKHINEFFDYYDDGDIVTYKVVLNTLFDSNTGRIYWGGKTSDGYDEKNYVWVENGYTSIDYNKYYNHERFNDIWFQVYLSDDNAGTVNCIVKALEKEDIING